MKSILFVIIYTMISSFSFAETRDESEIINIHETDAEMNAAMARANQSLDTFINRFKNPQKGDANFALKVIVTDDNGVEHFWVTELSITNSGFEGFIANEAKTVKAVTIGQKVRFERDIVTDWSFDSNGVKQGAYTLKVLLKRMPKEQADYYKKKVGWD